MSDIVGRTTDGKVFLKTSHVGNNGEPLETTIIWEAPYAAEIGQCLMSAAEAAAAMKDKDNDSSATNKRSP